MAPADDFRTFAMRGMLAKTVMRVNAPRINYSVNTGRVTMAKQRHELKANGWHVRDRDEKCRFGARGFDRNWQMHAQHLAAGRWRWPVLWACAINSDSSS